MLGKQEDPSWGGREEGSPGEAGQAGVYARLHCHGQWSYIRYPVSYYIGFLYPECMHVCIAMVIIIGPLSMPNGIFLHIFLFHPWVLTPSQSHACMYISLFWTQQNVFLIVISGWVGLKRHYQRTKKYHTKVIIMSLATGTVFFKLEFFPDQHNITFIPLPQQVVQMIQPSLWISFFHQQQFLGKTQSVYMSNIIDHLCYQHWWQQLVTKRCLHSHIWMYSLSMLGTGGE